MIPHFAIPFRFAGGAAVVTEQDTTDEILGCELAILLCPVGFRVELPEFGIADPTFSQGIPDVDAIAAALIAWEPRSQDTVAGQLDALDELISHVMVRVGTPSDD
jgi:hypothetical protein